MWNMKALSLMVHKLWPRLKFLKSRSNFKVNASKSKNYGMTYKVSTQGIHVKYESLAPHGLQVMTKVKVFEKKVKVQGH